MKKIYLNKKGLFLPDGCMATDTLKRIAAKQLVGAELSSVMEHINNCRFCSDVLDGLQSMPMKDSSLLEVEMINRRIAKKFVHSKTSDVNDRYYLYTVLSVAAAAIILFALFVPGIYIGKPAYLSIEDVYVSAEPVGEKLILTPMQGILKKRAIPTEVTDISLQQNQPTAVPKPTYSELGNDTLNNKALLAQQFDSAQLVPSVTKSIKSKVKKLSPKPTSTEVKHNEKPYRRMESKVLAENYIVLNQEENAGLSFNRDRKPLVISYNIASPATNQSLIEGANIGKGNDLTEKFCHPEIPKFNNEAPTAFLRYVRKNIRYPKSAIELDMSGVLYVRFGIDEKGNVFDVKLVNSINPAFDNEVMRVITTSPQWLPGLNNCESSIYYFTFPIVFAMK